MTISRITATLAALTFAGSAAFAQVNPPSSNPSTPANGNTNVTDANRIANAANPTDPSTLQDKAFIHEAAEGGLAEIQLGQLAAKKGSTDDVRQFGQRMVTDHQQLNDQLKPFAQSKGVSLPKKPGKKMQAEYVKLNALSGEAFDKEYVSMMVDDHQKDLKEFKQEANNTTDPQLKETVQKGADVVQQHLTAIEEIAKAKGVAGGSTGGQ